MEERECFGRFHLLVTQPFCRPQLFSCASPSPLRSSPALLSVCRAPPPPRRPPRSTAHNAATVNCSVSRERSELIKNTEAHRRGECTRGNVRLMLKDCGLCGNKNIKEKKNGGGQKKKRAHREREESSKPKISLIPFYAFSSSTSSFIPPGSSWVVVLPDLNLEYLRTDLVFLSRTRIAICAHFHTNMM